MANTKNPNEKKVTRPIRRVARNGSRAVVKRAPTKRHIPRARMFGRYIVADPDICHGKPTFRGSRVMVQHVLEQVADGMVWDTIVEEWRGSVSKDAIAEAVRLSSMALPVVEDTTPIQPSATLLERARHYLDIVDSGDETRQANERTQAHEALMDAMEAEHIPFNARWEARWIARWVLADVAVSEGKHTTIMFAKIPARYDAGEYDPVRDGVLELTSFPFRNEDDERANAACYIPVLVTVEALREYEGARYERNK